MSVCPIHSGAENHIDHSTDKCIPASDRHADHAKHLMIELLLTDHELPGMIQDHEIPGGKQRDCMVIKDEGFPGLKRFVPVLMPVHKSSLYSKRLNTGDWKDSIDSMSTLSTISEEQLSTIDESSEESDRGSEHGSLTPQLSPDSAKVGELSVFNFANNDQLPSSVKFANNDELSFSKLPFTRRL